MGSPPQGDMATQLGAQDWVIKSGSGVLNLYNGAYRVLYFDTSGAITFLPSQGGSFPTANLTVAEGADLHGYINSRLGTPLEINTVNGDNVLLGGQVGKYRNITTFGYGVPAVFGNARSTAQTGAVASVATYTLDGVDGSFLVTANVLVTTSTTHNFTVTCTYTDETSVVRTLTFTFSNVGGTLATAIINTGGAVPYEGVPLFIRAKSATAITIATTGTFTSVTYNVEGLILRVA